MRSKGERLGWTVAEPGQNLNGKPKKRSMKKTGIELIAQERERQINVEGWQAAHDDTHVNGDLAHAAAAYAMAEVYRRVTPLGYSNLPDQWPWDLASWKPSSSNRIKELVKAGALIAAEIDRLRRLEK